MTVSSTVPYDTMSTTSERGESLLTKCCCCIPLRIGCFILGYLHLIFNTFHTLALATLTTYIGVSTHGFDHIDYDRSREMDQFIPDVETAEKPFLNQIGIALVVVLCANIAWLMINIACLVGLHKRQPGPVRMYVAFAAARIMLSLAGFVYLIMTASVTLHTVVAHGTDIGVGSYFVLVYYIYAKQLEREQYLEKDQMKTEDEKSAITEKPGYKSNIAFIYPASMDKQNLVHV